MRTRTPGLCVSLVAIVAIGCTETPSPTPAGKSAPQFGAAPSKTPKKVAKNPKKGNPLGPEEIVE